MKYRLALGSEVVNYVFFPSVFLLVNYAFINLILSYIRFYNDLLIISDGQIIVIKASLLFMDDIEFIDISKITKIDTFTRGIIANIIGYGNLVIEQQRDQVRTFHYIPDARNALHIIKAEKEKIVDMESKNRKAPTKVLKDEDGDDDLVL